MSCPSWQWHRTGYSWSPVQTLPGAPLWCDLGFFLNSSGNEAAENLHPTRVRTDTVIKCNHFILTCWFSFTKYIAQTSDLSWPTSMTVKMCVLNYLYTQLASYTTEIPFWMKKILKCSEAVLKNSQCSDCLLVWRWGLQDTSLSPAQSP